MIKKYVAFCEWSLGTSIAFIHSQNGMAKIIRDCAEDDNQYYYHNYSNGVKFAESINQNIIIDACRGSSEPIWMWCAVIFHQK